MSVSSDDLRGLSLTTVRSLQFYSGREKIIFEAMTDKTIREVNKETLSLTNLSTEHKRIIKKKTPGTVTRFDPISQEIHIKFDPDIPALIYMDQGEGLELVTFEFMSGGLTYSRVLSRPLSRRGRMAADDHRFLTVKKKDETKKKRDKKKAKGLRASVKKN